MRTLLRLAALSLATAACGPNPAFILAGASNSMVAESTSDAGDTSDTSADETAVQPRCEPVPLQEIEDACDTPAFPFTPPNMMTQTMFSDVACGTKSDLYLKRESASQLQQCASADCLSGCDPARSINVSGFSNFAALDSLLPEVGECARLWHVSKADLEGTCTSASYAFWDAGDSRALRFAITIDDINPFTGVTGLPIDVSITPGMGDPCAKSYLECLTAFQFEVLTVNLDGCEFLAPQTAEWKDIPFDGHTYVFSARSYSCLGGSPRFFAWFLRRA